MRIIAGRMRGTRLADLGAGDAAAHLRPTADRVRGSIFDILSGALSDALPQGARVLDLFAGTGAMGLEALSRGAVHVTFVDTGATAARLIRRNIQICGAEAETRLLQIDAVRLGPCPTAPFDLVFVDPPYGQGLGEKALAAARAGNWLAPGAIAVQEDRDRTLCPEGFQIVTMRRYGIAHIAVLRCG